MEQRTSPRPSGIGLLSRTRQLLRAVKSIAQSPSRITTLKKTQEKIQQEIGNIKGSLDDRYSEILLTKNDLDITKKDLVKKVDDYSKKLADIQHKITILDRERNTSDVKEQRKTLADNHLLDQFYIEFENRFRGTEKDIYDRLKVYVPYLTSNKSKKDKPVLDIGCGRGEMLKLLKSQGIEAIGLDLNASMAQRVRDQGYEVIEQDALSYLLSCSSNSLRAITGFHIVEHIPFDDLLQIFAECYRVLVPGGKIIFETPNPENTLVGSWRFYYDPSHLKPLPPDMLEFAIQSVGFEKTEVLRLHPVEELENKTSMDEKVKSVLDHFYGPQDYSVIATK
jgi:O-antigen chain-terminating methyltransferase